MKHKPSAIRFFYSNAGYGYDPAIETRNQGRWKCARRMAEAEKLLLNTDVNYEYFEDFDDCVLGDTESVEDYHSGKYLMFTCQLKRGNQVLASLSGVSVSSSNDPYLTRVVGAELALEAIDDLEDILAESTERQGVG